MKSKKPGTMKADDPKASNEALDTIPDPAAIPARKKRGRKRVTPWEWVTGRAANYEFQLKAVWNKLEPQLIQAKTETDVIVAFTAFGKPYDREFVPGFASDILALLDDPDFPKRPGPRLKFVARSLAGRPSISFRTSRDICEKAATQKKIKSPHRTIRREFYVECSCGYKGPAFDNACRQCGAQPPLSLYEWTGKAPSGSQE